MSTALYNRYRPATFSQVVGQDHVTGALMQALRTGRLHHAYLFSGPRGCGKTSSARILAASLNCEQGPTPEPCGVCDQCVAIRTGSSMDVTEIDAASHGLVDDARDLRERAFFAPASARFKVFVVDEAHMVTAAAFNALLKVVEEPPPYLKFVFATTEPDKVIATIRSRTHHYAFRLVPPGILRDHLAKVAAQEGVDVDPEVLPLVVRAGAGSVRDSLSVLDQLLAGAGPEGLRYDRAVALLGMTDGVLLDEAVEALAARDGATLFTVVDKVVGSGHDPRRFTADLLERLRDLIMIKAVPDAVERGLLEAFSSDQVDRMKAQAGRVGPAELSRTADVLHAGLGEMRGTASPRLLLELVLARALLPGAASDSSALLTRLERLERGMAAGVPVAAAPAVTAPPAVAPTPPPTTPARVTPPPAPPAAEPGWSAPQPPSGNRPTAGPPQAQAAPAGWGAPPSAPPAPPTRPAAAPPPAQWAPAPQQQSPAPPMGGSSPEAGTVRAMWDQVLATTRRRKVVTAALLGEHATVLDVRDNEVFLGFSGAQLARVFGQGNHVETLCAALGETFGGTWRVTIGEPGAGGGGMARGGTPGRPPASPPSGFGGPGGGGHPAPSAAQPPQGPTSFGPPPQGGGVPTGFAPPSAAPVGYATGTATQAPPAYAAPPAPRSGGDFGGQPHALSRAPVGTVLDDAPARPAPAAPVFSPPANSRPAPTQVAAAPSPSAGPGNGGAVSARGPAMPEFGPPVVDEPSLDDEDAPSHPGSALGGEAAAVELLRSSLGATVIEERS